MADNYLEKQMADYRSGRLNRTRAITTAPRVFIISDDFAKTEQMVRQYRTLGYRTAFTCKDAKAGAILAQTTGSQFHHTTELTQEAISHSLAYIGRHWGGVDSIIDLR